MGGIREVLEWVRGDFGDGLGGARRRRRRGGDGFGATELVGRGLRIWGFEREGGGGLGIVVVIAWGGD